MSICYFSIFALFPKIFMVVRSRSGWDTIFDSVSISEVKERYYKGDKEGK